MRASESSPNNRRTSLYSILFRGTHSDELCIIVPGGLFWTLLRDCSDGTSDMISKEGKPTRQGKGEGRVEKSFLTISARLEIH